MFTGVPMGGRIIMMDGQEETVGSAVEEGGMRGGTEKERGGGR